MIPYRPIPVIHIAAINIGVAPLMSTLGFLVMGYFAAREFRKKKIITDRNEFLKFFLLLVITSLAGGRLWYFAEHFQGLTSLAIFFNVLQPGLASFGMIFGGLLFLILWIKSTGSKKTKITKEIGKYADPLALYAPLFVAIYRIGCFFNGCCYGIKTKMAWALYNTETGIARHPTQIYEIISVLAIFLLLKLFLRRKRFDGEIALWFLTLYSAGRFVTDFFRFYSEHYLELSLSQWVCIGIFSASLGLLSRIYWHQAKH